MQDILELDLGLDTLDITTTDLNFDDVDGAFGSGTRDLVRHACRLSCRSRVESIQANLEDDMVRDALNRGVDLRQYARHVEKELTDVEYGSVRDCA